MSKLARMNGFPGGAPWAQPVWPQNAQLRFSEFFEYSACFCLQKVLQYDQWNTIRDGYSAYTANTVYTVYTVYTVKTALHCFLNSSMYAYC